MLLSVKLSLHYFLDTYKCERVAEQDESWCVVR